MVEKRSRLKKPVKRLLIIICLLVIILLIPLSIRLYNSSKLSKLHYDKQAINVILKKHKQKYVYEVGENKMLNAAFQSDDYQEKYLKDYTKITYQNHKNLIKNVNTLLSKKYNCKEISAIIARGNDEDVSSFAKRDKVDNVLEYLQFEYAKLSNYDRYVDYEMKERTDAEDTVTYVNLNLDKEYYTDSILISKYSETVLANKYRQLGEEYVPDDLMKIKEEYAVDDEQYLTKVAVEAFEKMAKDAAKEGFSILANSAYRSYQDQQEVYDVYKDLYGQKYVDNYVALAGYSEHQTGLALDVSSANNKVFADSKEYNWMLENSYKYGFIMRYPKDKEKITGYKYEAWHYRYVGKEIAKYIYENDLTYDEYYIRFLDK